MPWMPTIHRKPLPHGSPDDLRHHPLARWVELRLGLEREDGRADGKWVRCRPRTLQDAALELATPVGVWLRMQTPIQKPGSRSGMRCSPACGSFCWRPTRWRWGRTAASLPSACTSSSLLAAMCTASLEAPGRRYLTLKGQKYQPNAGRQALLYPVVFCRSCGQEFHPVWAHLHNRRPERFEPREFSDESSLRERDVVNGYLMPDADGAYEVEDLEKARFPDGWLETDATASWCSSAPTGSLRRCPAASAPMAAPAVTDCRLGSSRAASASAPAAGWSTTCAAASSASSAA